jgi:hypothetical protein
MPDTLALTPSESVTVVNDSPEALEVEATYGAHGSAPPKHLHPAQAEHFEVLAGSLNTRVDGRTRPLEYRDVFRLAGAPDPLLRTAFALLAPIGRMRGYGVSR